MPVPKQISHTESVWFFVRSGLSIGVPPGFRDIKKRFVMGISLCADYNIRELVSVVVRVFIFFDLIWACCTLSLPNWPGKDQR